MLAALKIPLCALALAGGVALAQETVGNVFFAAETAGPKSHLAMQDFVVATFGEKAVVGRPYSADGVTEFTQKLPDGTTISRKNTSSVARDSQGRTRREQTINVIGPFVPEGEAPKTITIFDPVAGETITLNPRDKVARRIKLPPGPPAGAEEGKVTHMQKEVQVRIEGPVERGEQAAFAGARYNVMVHRGTEDAKTENLGTTTIEGIVADGTRTTVTIPAGEIGNDRPIATVSTRWFSQDLATIVMSETDDPLAGKTVFRLTNIRQAEPSATLFQIPPDYTVKDARDLPGRGLVIQRDVKQ